MKVGIVTGNVWASKKSESLTGHPLLLVSTDAGLWVADDLVGAGVGDAVLVSTGGAARLGNPEAPIDAAIVAILDQTEDTHVN